MASPRTGGRGGSMEYSTPPPNSVECTTPPPTTMECSSSPPTTMECTSSPPTTLVCTTPPPLPDSPDLPTMAALQLEDGSVVGAGRAQVVAPGRPWGWLVPAHETTPVIQVSPLVASCVRVGRAGGEDRVQLRPTTIHTPWPSPAATPFVADMRHISKVHFELQHSSGGTYIVSKSINGTWVNQQHLQVGRTYPLRSGDRVGVGSPSPALYTVLVEAQVRAACRRTATPPVEVTARYLVGSRLGRGAFATVKKGWARRGLSPVALKFIPKEAAEAPEAVWRQQGRELAVMRRLAHPCLARLLDHAESALELVLVMELCRGGELGAWARLARERGDLTEELVMFWFYQVVQAVIYLHKKNVCHRDIKLANILLVDLQYRSLVKVVDFGVSRLVPYGGSMETRVGSHPYVAPEVYRLGGGETPRDTYTLSCDCWGLGVLLYTLLTGRFPFSTPGLSLTGVFEPLGGGTSGEAAHLVSNLLQVSPCLRPPASSILAFPWVRTHRAACQEAHSMMYSSHSWGEEGESALPLEGEGGQGELDTSSTRGSLLRLAERGLVGDHVEEAEEQLMRELGLPTRFQGTGIVHPEVVESEDRREAEGKKVEDVLVNRKAEVKKVEVKAKEAEVKKVEETRGDLRKRLRSRRQSCMVVDSVATKRRVEVTEEQGEVGSLGKRRRKSEEPPQGGRARTRTEGLGCKVNLARRYARAQGGRLVKEREERRPGP